MESVMATRHKTATRTTGRKTATRKAGTARRKTGARKASPKRWSQRVTRESDALDLKKGVFKQTNAKKIASSLKRSAAHSSGRRRGAYRSALSMLTFYINRAGKTVPKTQRARLERAKLELKHQFGREETPPAATSSRVNDEVKTLVRSRRDQVACELSVFGVADLK